MLDIGPNCEIFEKHLPPESTEARICSYECSYCANCAESILHNVCSICGVALQHVVSGPKKPIALSPRLDWPIIPLEER